MPTPEKKHPAIRAIAWLSIIGGLITMGWSLKLLHTALEQQNWPSAQVMRDAGTSPHYRVAERNFNLDNLADTTAGTQVSMVFYNPNQPEAFIVNRPNFWWPLYLSMAGLIVFYAGLHLQRDRNRSVQQLGFE